MIPWIAPIAIALMVLAGALLVIFIPSKWDNAVLLKVCHDGTRILRLQDGTVRARNGYLVEDWQTVCW